MDEISKKDLLILTGISYGQLYRWKRKGLIPEEWFIKRASFTGQETYFPKDLILDRIDKILELKDDVSLEDLSEIISKKNNVKLFSKETLISREIFINSSVLNFEEQEQLTSSDILLLKIMDNIISKHKVKLTDFYSFLKKYSDKVLNNKYLYLFINDEKLSALFVGEECLDYNSQYLLKLDLNHLAENLKLLLFV